MEVCHEYLVVLAKYKHYIYIRTPGWMTINNYIIQNGVDQKLKQVGLRI